MRRRVRSPLLAALSLICVAGGADLASAAGINHFQAAAGSHNYLVTNHPAVLPNLTPSAWLITSYAHDPLVCRDKNGNEAYSIVEHQANTELAAALGLFDRFEIGAVVPATYLYGPAVPERPPVLCGDGALDPKGINELSFGDPRLLAKVLLTPWNQGVVASFRLSADLPLAQLNQKAKGFAGESFPNLTPAFTVGYASEWFRFGLDAGYLLRAPSKIGDLQVGHEIQYGAATELTIIPKTMYLTLDVYGKASPAFLFGNRDQFPLEGVGAIKLFFGPIVLIGGAGTGLIADYGSPDVRAFAGIGFYPIPEEEPEDKDRDGDGLKDSVDQCPDAPEDKDGFEDEDGCPDVDNDKDGILDIDDGCPDEPEDRDRWQDADGCPEPDNDEDQILDPDDECPNDPEIYNDFEDEDGCPDSRPEDKKKVVVVVKREKIEIKEKVFFAYDSDRILPQSYGLLDDVAAVIEKHPEIPKILVEGHTDADGSDSYNLDLSDRRAKSVMRYLIGAGVDAARLEAKGYGEGVPIASNETEEGKAKNRRVEFTIVDPEAADEEEAGEPEETEDAEGEDEGAAEEGPEGEDAEDDLEDE